MATLGQMGRRLWMLARRRRADRDLEDELQLHLDLLEKRQGTSFEALAGCEVGARYIHGSSGPERVMTVTAERGLFEVIGVAPIAQNWGQLSELGMTLVVSTQNRAEASIDAIRAVIREVSPNQAIFNIRTMDRVIADSLSDFTLYLWLMASFAALALILTSVGTLTCAWSCLH